MLHEIDIATGRSRKEVNWRNKTITWPALVEKLSNTHRTAETLAEYNAAKKTRQDEIKDIGGFVGGYMSGRRRVSTSIVHRQLVTLDVDFAKPGFWEDFALMYGNAACVYSTHKHTPEAPRLRLVIPLDREVMRDEYEPICRRIAGDLGIDLFDPTTYQPERLMYWPSTSKDGIFEFHQQDGPWLSADEVLGRYVDWRNSSEWPVSEAEGEVVARSIKKQGDPLEKPGIVGAFCRTYGIAEVIEKYLGDVYEPCDIENRYSYKEGSTAAGLVVYDDKFAYSHHGTDPVSGKLCNAFDLVRLHKFGLKDEDKDGVPTNKLPSYTAMIDLATKDKSVKALLGVERMEEAKYDFKDIELETEPENKDWMQDIEVDGKNNVLPTINNLTLIINNDPLLRGAIRFDDFEQVPVFTRNLPWREVTKETRHMTDRDLDNLEHYLETIHKISGTKMLKALSVVYEKHLFHPVREYLQAQVWDGLDRVDQLMIEYMGAEDSEYTRAVTRKALVAAVARIFKPGCKFDYVLTLIGEEGKGKSTLFNALGGQWFSDTFNLHMIQGKEAYEQIRGAWIIEIAELSGMARAEVERVKAFISAKSDRYRPAWARMVTNFPRQNIFFATTNKPDFLRSQTGNRRFWPVPIDIEKATKRVFTDLTAYEVGQVWAECVQYYQEGEPLYLSAALEAEALIRQKEHTEEHPWSGIIREFLEVLLPEDWHKMAQYDRAAFLQGEGIQAEGTVRRDRVCVMELWVYCLRQRGTIDAHSASIIQGIMRNTEGWKEVEKPTKFPGYGVQRRGFLRTGIQREFAEKVIREARQKPL